LVLLDKDKMGLASLVWFLLDKLVLNSLVWLLEDRWLDKLGLDIG